MMMKTFASFVLLVSSVQCRHLSQEPLGTFTPITQVTDHAAIDLDQAEIESLLANGQQFDLAELVYEAGANSKSIADLALDAPLPSEIAVKTPVTGLDTLGNPVSGKVYQAATAGSVSLQIQYTTFDTLHNHVGCRVGGSSAPVTDGCFAEKGSVRINGIAYTYSYTLSKDNLNGRTIQRFSTDTKNHHRFGNVNEKLYEDFNTHREYYGVTDYGDRLVKAALQGKDAGLSRGNQNYEEKAPEARVEGAKKGSAYLNIFMYVIRELEDALDDCELNCNRDECNDDAVHALDEAVAFYTGSLQGGNGGNLLYALAEKRCIDFNTCSSTTGMSKVNEQIFVQFRAMQDRLLRKDCPAARKNKERIVDLMYIPMIQGALRYSYFQDYRNDVTAKSNAEGAAFAAAVLPRIHACDQGDAASIYDYLHLGSSFVDHDDVKRSFEGNYYCMRITCEDIGGLSDGENYFDGAEPCGGRNFARTAAGKSVTGVGVSLAILLALAFGGILLRRRRNTRSEANANSDGVVRQVEMGSKDIA